MNLKTETEIGFDIETIKNVDMENSLPEPEVKYGNTKDPEKRRVKFNEAKAKQIENMALNPFYGRICSYAIYGNEGQISYYEVINEINDKAEADLIKEIFQELSYKNKESLTIITWNGDNFDMRFLYTRASILKVDLPVGAVSYRTMCKRYENEYHIDLMTVLNRYGTYGKLNEAVNVYLKDQKIDIDVHKFIELIQSGQGNVIGEYNLKDSELTYRLYKQVQPYFLGV